MPFQLRSAHYSPLVSNRNYSAILAPLHLQGSENGRVVTIALVSRGKTMFGSGYENCPEFAHYGQRPGFPYYNPTIPYFKCAYLNSYIYVNIHMASITWKNLTILSVPGVLYFLKLYVLQPINIIL